MFDDDYGFGYGDGYGDDGCGGGYGDLDQLASWMDDPWLAAAAVMEAPVGLPSYCCPTGTPEQPPYNPPPGATCPPGYQLLADGTCAPPPPPPPPPSIPTCPPGTTMNSRGDCVPPYYPPPTTGDCPPGYVLRPIYSQNGTNVVQVGTECVPAETPCPPGWVRDPITGQCIGILQTPPDKPPPAAVCPPGYQLASDGRCYKRFVPNFPSPTPPYRPQIPRPDIPPVTGACPPGMVWDGAECVFIY